VDISPMFQTCLVFLACEKLLARQLFGVWGQKFENMSKGVAMWQVNKLEKYWLWSGWNDKWWEGQESTESWVPWKPTSLIHAIFDSMFERIYPS
jgi:hypothetical protein